MVGKSDALDDLDRKILRCLQQDTSRSLEELAKIVGASKTPVWNRVRKLQAAGIIDRQVAILNADKIGLNDTFFVAIRTSQHDEDWLKAFTRTVHEMPEIQEAHRLAGEIDYLLKVRVANTRDFDTFYKSFIGRINLFNVTSSLSMETIKSTTMLKV